MKFRDYIPFYKRNLKVAIPVMITQAGQVVVNLADNIMVGHLGAGELAGVSFANAVFMMGLVFTIGFTQGITPIVGQSYGEGRHEHSARIFQNSIVINIIMSVIVTLIMFAVGLNLDKMGQNEEVLTFAKQYYFISVLTIVPMVLFLGARFFSEGIGNTKNAMYITLFVNVLNIFLNWILIFGNWGAPKMGVAGAAYATLISRIVAMVLFIILLFTISPYKQYFKMMCKPVCDKISIRNLLKTSFPISLQSLLEAGAFSIAAIMVGWIGKYELAGHQVAQSLSHFTFMLALGFGAAATIRVSHQFGGKNYIETRMAGIAAIHMSVSFMAFFGIIFIIFRNDIPFIFSNDPKVIAFASQIIVVMAMYQIFDALQLSAVSSLRGLKDINKPLLYSSISYYVICLPAAYILGFIFNLGVIGVWIGLLLGLMFAGILFFIRFDKLSKHIIATNGDVKL
ncbi:MAG: MATE family efflux transporter [Bacteroidales bacterium]|nr:MATE family efflux transporter [Bacteroidales bacterium]MDD4670199.1 MATE family efflux transporter [Bacteroidales bacterium]